MYYYEQVLHLRRYVLTLPVGYLHRVTRTPTSCCGISAVSELCRRSDRTPVTSGACVSAWTLTTCWQDRTTTKSLWLTCTVTLLSSCHKTSLHVEELMLLVFRRLDATAVERGGRRTQGQDHSVSLAPHTTLLRQHQRRQDCSLLGTSCLTCACVFILTSYSIYAVDLS